MASVKEIFQGLLTRYLLDPEVEKSAARYFASIKSRDQRRDEAAEAKLWNQQFIDWSRRQRERNPRLSATELALQWQKKSVDTRKLSSLK